MDDLLFYATLTVFQSYRDDGRVFKKSWLGGNGRPCAMEPLLRLERLAPPAGLEPETARSADKDE